LPTPRLVRTAAVVLRRHDFGEADRLVTLYTEHAGKIKALAKGVRRTTSRLGGHLELFCYVELMLARGRNLDTITQVETIDPFVGIRDDLWRTSLAYFASELLDRLTEDHSANAPLFRSAVAVFGRIASSDRPQPALQLFIVRALDLLGFRPELSNCVSCRNPLRPSGNAFNLASGGVLCRDCRSLESRSIDLSTSALKILRLFLADDWSTVTRLRVDAALAGEIESLLSAYTQFVTETRLKSDAFVQELRRDGLAQATR
jgi:DNA repair protein RecO (recombination protein O)